MIMDIIEIAWKALECSGAFRIGTSACGRPILCAHVGQGGGTQLIITAAIHARECYTATVVLRQMRELDRAVKTGGVRGGAWFVPIVNPDGAAFFDTGDTSGAAFLEANADKRLVWKANAEGVDLNCNFDARWGSGKLNKTVRGASDYIGSCPFCAPETRALAAFTRHVRPSATVSYHCMGGELYWEFFQTGERRLRDLALATVVAEHIGVKRIDGDLGSAGGYKDYCVMRHGMPAMTVELIAEGEHPFGAEDFEADAERNARLPEMMIDYINSTETKRR